MSRTTALILTAFAAALSAAGTLALLRTDALGQGVGSQPSEGPLAPSSRPLRGEPMRDAWALPPGVVLPLAKDSTIELDQLRLWTASGDGRSEAR